jgi:hypothetical protein
MAMIAVSHSINNCWTANTSQGSANAHNCSSRAASTLINRNYASTTSWARDFISVVNRNGSNLGGAAENGGAGRPSSVKL